MVDGMAVVHCRTLAGARAPAGRRACGAGEGALASSRPVHRCVVRLRSVARRPVPRAALRAVLLDPFDAPGRDVAGRVLVRVAVPSAAGAVKERAAAALRVLTSTPRAGGRGPSRVHLDAPGAVAHAAPLDALVELGEPRFRQRVVQAALRGRAWRGARSPCARRSCWQARGSRGRRRRSPRSSALPCGTRRCRVRSPRAGEAPARGFEAVGLPASPGCSALLRGA